MSDQPAPRRLTYDLYEEEDQAPRPGQYMVSVGKKGVGSVWFVQQVRLVAPRMPRPFRRYQVTVLHTPELKPFADLEGDRYDPRVWVRGVEALPMVWYPRSPKRR